MKSTLSSSRRINIFQCTKSDESQDQRNLECYTETFCCPVSTVDTLPVDESNLKSHVWVEDPRKQQVTKPKSTGEPDYHEEEVLSSAPDQLHNCDEVQPPEHTHTRTDAVGDNPLDVVERVAVEPCDDVPTADAHTTTPNQVTRRRDSTRLLTCVPPLKVNCRL